MRAVFEAPFGHVAVSVDDQARARRVELSQDAREDAVPGGFPAGLAEAFEAYLGARAGGVDVPVRVEVSAFQEEVLGAAGRVPAGRTVTYGDLAERVGRPGAARAVGQALAQNPVPLVVPCHRVVGATGLGGFMGEPEAGASIKRWLLEHEARLEAGPR